MTRTVGHFLENYTTISNTIYSKVLQKESYSIYNTPVASGFIKTTAEKILIKMKSEFENTLDTTPRSITLQGKDLGIVSSHVRPLFGIFKEAGITLSISSETTLPWLHSPISSKDLVERKIYDMTYAQPILTISLMDQFT